MPEGAFSPYTLAIIVAVVGVAVIAAFMLVTSHRRSYPKPGGPYDPAMPPFELMDRSNSEAGIAPAPKFSRGEMVRYVSRRHGSRYGGDDLPLRSGFFLNFDHSGRARVDIGGNVVRRRPHLLRAHE